MKLLVDHNLSPRIARCLQALFEEHEIVALRDKFPPNTDDADWIVPSLWLRRVRLPRQRPELPVAQLHGEGPRDGAEQPLTLLGRGCVT